MPRPIRPPQHKVQQDVHGLVRAFGGKRMRVYRRSARPLTTNDMGEPQWGEVTVFEGEALFIPAGGVVKVFGLGRVEEQDPQLLIPGERRGMLAQGDFFSHNNTLYEILHQPDFWPGFTLCRAKKYQQGT